MQLFRRDRVPGNERGTSYVELLVVLGLIGVVSGIAIPALTNALDRNKVYSSTQLVSAAIRNARLAAISRNTPYRVRFNCPSAGGVRVLVVTGNAAVDNAANRCATSVAEDGPAMFLPQGVSYGTVPTLEVNGRGQMSVPAAAMPLTISVTYENFSQSLSITASGRVRTPSS
jgi:Tfp pilus assembly protein FimT